MTSLFLNQGQFLLTYHEFFGLQPIRAFDREAYSYR